MKYTVKEAAAISGLKCGKIRWAIQKGELKTVRCGWYNLIDKADFVEWWKTLPPTVEKKRKQPKKVPAWKMRLRVSEAASVAGYSQSGIYLAIRSGKLKATKEFGKVWIERAELDEWRKRKKTSV